MQKPQTKILYQIKGAYPMCIKFPEIQKDRVFFLSKKPKNLPFVLTKIDQHLQQQQLNLSDRSLKLCISKAPPSELKTFYSSASYLTPNPKESEKYSLISRVQESPQRLFQKYDDLPQNKLSFNVVSIKTTHKIKFLKSSKEGNNKSPQIKMFNHSRVLEQKYIIRKEDSENQMQLNSQGSQDFNNYVTFLAENKIKKQNEVNFDLNSKIKSINCSHLLNRSN